MLIINYSKKLGQYIDLAKNQQANNVCVPFGN